MNFVSELFSVW